MATQRAETLLPRATNTLLLIVDIQERMYKAMPEADQASIARFAPVLVKAARELGVPIIATEQYPKGLGGTLPELKKTLDEARARWFEKLAFSVLGEEQIGKAIQDLGKQHIIVAGVETHVCVYQSVADLLEADYEVHIPQECVASRARENKETGLWLMRELGASVTSVEALLFSLLQRADHPKFKAVQALIK